MEERQSPSGQANGDTSLLLQLPTPAEEDERPAPSNAANKPEATTIKVSLESIRRKLSHAGLTDGQKSPSLPNHQLKPTTTHRRSRSVGELLLCQGSPLAVAATKVKRSCADLLDAPPRPQGKEGATTHITASEELKVVKEALLKEIQIRLRKQIEAKQQSKCHTEGGEGGEVEKQPAKEQPVEPEKEPKCVLKRGTSAEEGKRISVCSLNGGVELRKRYSPVYERTRKIVRQSSSSINRFSTSQPQVVTPQPPPGPTSPATASLDTEGTATVLSPVTSKGDLEREEEEEQQQEDRPPPNGIAMPRGNGGGRAVRGEGEQEEEVSNQQRVGHYSAHPSVYVIEQQQQQEDRRMAGSSNIDTSQSDRMDRSTSTLKRGASFRGLKKGIKKTFSTQLPAITLEKADKAPDTNVPAIVICCVETLRRKGFLKTEGLYRSSPSQLEVRKVIKHARKGQYEYIKSVEDPVILAGTLKSFFFNLKQHIISDEVLRKNFPKKCLSGHLSEQEYLDRLRGVIADLDTVHYESLEYIIKHLQEVASLSKFNLMTPSNLGVVWAPCLFTNCDQSMEGADLLSFMGEQTRLLELMITHADQLFDRYTLDEIMIAIEDGYTLDDGEPTLNLRPNFDSMLGDGSRLGGPAAFERRKLMRNLSLTFDNVYEAAEGNTNGHCSGAGRNYDLQNSSTVPAISCARSDGTVVPRIQKMKRSRSKAVCVVS